MSQDLQGDHASTLSPQGDSDDIRTKYFKSRTCREMFSLSVISSALVAMIVVFDLSSFGQLVPAH